MPEDRRAERSFDIVVVHVVRTRWDAETGRYRGREAVAEILALLKNSPDREVRGDTRLYLRDLGREQALQAIWLMQWCYRISWAGRLRREASGSAG